MTQPQQWDFNPQDRNPKAFEIQTLRERIVAFLRRDAISALAIPTTWTLARDTSHWNTFDSNLIDGVFHWLKATESTWYTDPTFAQRWPVLLDRGKRLGAFHFFRANQSVSDQVDYFLSAIEPLRVAAGGRILIAGDFESTDGVTLATRQQRAGEFLRLLEVEFRKPFMYSSQYLWQTMYGNPSWGNLYYGWVAQWANISAPSAIPVGWDPAKLLFWQNGIWNNHLWIAPVYGAVPDIDNDWYMNTTSHLDTLLGYQTELTLEQRVTRLEDEARLHGWAI